MCPEKDCKCRFSFAPHPDPFNSLPFVTLACPVIHTAMGSTAKGRFKGSIHQGDPPTPLKPLE